VNDLYFGAVLGLSIAVAILVIDRIGGITVDLPGLIVATFAVAAVGLYHGWRECRPPPTGRPCDDPGHPEAHRPCACRPDGNDRRPRSSPEDPSR
jgi:hypothetical protein